jgi:hypothetical protein
MRRDEALVVAEELHPRQAPEPARTAGLGTRWVAPIRLERHRAVIVRGAATKIRRH